MTYKELKEEAIELNLEFSGNVSKEALIELINTVKDVPTEEPEEEYIMEKVEVIKSPTTEKIVNLSQVAAKRVYISKMKKAANTLKVVTITDNDSRENSNTSTVTVSCTNAYLDLPTLRIPLNVPVEIKQGYIDVLRGIRITNHIRTSGGNNKAVDKLRYSISNG